MDHAVKGWQGSANIPRTDPPLSPTHGLMQAVETGLHYRQQRLRSGGAQQQDDTSNTTMLGGVRSYCIRSSPYLRCWQTAVLVSIVGFDGHAPITVDPALGDWKSTKLYPNGGPVLCGSLTDSSFELDRQLMEHTILEGLRALEECKALLRRHNIKPKCLARWRSLASGYSTASVVHDGRSLTLHPTYPESLSAFRQRCQLSLSAVQDERCTLTAADGKNESVTVELRVTHADVIDQVLASFLPRVGHKFTGGLSVPYCSITTLVPFATRGSGEGQWKLKVGSTVGEVAHLRCSALEVSFIQ